MPVMNVGTENSGPINLYYEDYGSGAPVVLIHGYPLSGRAWDKQVPPLLAAGHRVITYDRRGAGKSSQPASGYDWDTFAADLKVLIDELGLDGITLVGHSMGTGEVTRYLGNYGSSKVTKAVLIGPIPPYLSQARANILEHGRDRVAGGLGRGDRQQPRVLLALQHPVHHLPQVQGREHPAVGAGVDRAQEAQRRSRQFSWSRTETKPLGPAGSGPASRWRKAVVRRSIMSLDTWRTTVGSICSTNEMNGLAGDAWRISAWKCRWLFSTR